MTNVNKDWQREQDRVNNVRTEIDRRMIGITENVSGIKEGIIGLRKNFWEDVTINLDDVHEVGETFTSIKQQVELLSERERTHKQLYKQIHSLKRLANSPYFGRIDFRENGEKASEQIYVGLASLMDEKDEAFLVYDWRAPISSLYYNYSPGRAEYEVPEETIEGEVELKRQYIIKDGQLKSMFDTGVTIGDELLQEVLSNNANTQMKSIVATIQREQNQIIRNERSKYLIVQGVAGSGKTSAALQRVAYLLYRFRGQINADNIMLFSPNFLFNSYIATVLPELGEENMQQTTFQSYVERRLGKFFSIEDPFELMEFTYSGYEDPIYATKMAAIKYKASEQYKELIDAYIKTLSQKDLIFNDIKFRGESFFTANEIEKYFYSLDPTIAISNRIHLTAEWLLVQLTKLQKEEMKKDWVREESELLDKEDYAEVFNDIQGNQHFNEETFDDLEREEKLLAKLIIKKHMKPIKNVVKKLRFIDVKSIYSHLFTKKIFGELQGVYFPEKWEDICSYTLDKLKNNELMYEDTTPYLYLKDQLEGRKPNTTIRHLFIDEAQDYSPFQFAFLKQLFPNSRITILGDLNQAIFAHTMNSLTLLSPQVTEKMEKHERITLTRSYRSTRQIVDFTKELIEGGDAIEPFNRDGELPTFFELDDEKKFLKSMVERVTNLKEKGHQTIAIICKTAKESKEAYKKLSGELTIHLMDKEAQTFSKGISVLPTYLAKGIEFDAVIIYNASNESYSREVERKLFYTACTRAMHELHLFSLGPKSKFFASVNENTYNQL